MALKWKRLEADYWQGQGGKYSYSIERVKNKGLSEDYYRVNRKGHLNVVAKSLNEAKCFAEQDIINDILKEDADKYSI